MQIAAGYFPPYPPYVSKGGTIIERALLRVFLVFFTKRIQIEYSAAGGRYIITILLLYYAIRTRARGTPNCRSVDAKLSFGERHFVVPHRLYLE